MAKKGYNAKTGVDIEVLKGNWLNDLIWEFLDGLDNPFDFALATAFNLVIWNKKARTRGRSILVTLSDGTGELSESGGQVILDCAFPSELDFGSFNYELSFDTAAEADQFLAEGTIKVI